MIIETRINEVIIEGGEEQHEMHVAHDRATEEHIMRMLMKAYSNPIASLIREAASNGVDSHRMAGVDEPIICRCKPDETGAWYFEMEDFGLGLDETDFHKYIMGIGQSSKQGLAGVIGCYGIGAKAPSSYTEVYYYTCRKDGVERKFMIFQGEDRVTSEKMYEVPTKDRNGVVIRVPIKSGDKIEFIDAIKEQLCYFEGVFFDVQGINNGFKIHRGKDWQWSELCPDGEMHISMDNVYYPIDWKNIGLSRIGVPIALKFSLTDGLTPIPNRENLEYTKATIKLIRDKITAVATHLIGEYNKTIEETDDYKKVFDYYAYTNRGYKIENSQRIIYINNLVLHSTIPLLTPTLKGYKYLDFKNIYTNKDNLFQDYQIEYIIRNGGMTGKVKGWVINLSTITKEGVYIISEHPKKLYIDYLKDLKEHVVLIGKCSEFHLGNTLYQRRKYSDYTSYYQLLNLKSHPRESWREIIKEFQRFRAHLMSHIPELVNLKIPEKFIEDRKAQRITYERRKIEGGEISLGVATNLERSVSGKNCKFVREVYRYKDLVKIGSLVVYGRDKDSKILDNLYTISKKWGNKKNKMIIPVLLTDREYNKLHLLNLNSCIEIGKFMEGKTKPFKKIVTAMMLYKFKEKNPLLFSQSTQIKMFSTALYDDIVKIETYSNNYNAHCHTELEKSILEYAEKNNLWDEAIMPIYKRALNLAKAFEFIKHLKIDRYSTTWSPELVEFVKEHLKLKKVRLNLDCYSQPQLFENA